MEEFTTAIILLNYNNASDTMECLASIQSSEEKALAVVVDNASKQEGIEEVLKYPNVVLIENNDNLGYSRGNNVGLWWALRHTNCQYFLILNNDTTIHPNSITELYQGFSEAPQAGVVVPKIVMMSNHNALWYGNGRIRWWFGGGKIPGALGPTDTKLANTAENVEFGSGCAMLIARKVIEDVGGFDPRFFMYEEDIEYSIRIIKGGYDIYYYPSSVILHKGQGSTAKDGGKYYAPKHPKNKNLVFMAYHGYKNRLLNMLIHARGKHLLQFLLGYGIYLANKLGRYVLHGRFKAIKEVFRGMKDSFVQYRKPFHDEVNDTEPFKEIIKSIRHSEMDKRVPFKEGVVL